ncbi:unnamed protein product [Linum trigynum]|uniref:Uncharacterized protein n=1 Tax=Linum trigynum TaxID=586398 RepID=A0AAV2G008_9ROSI
MDHLTTHNERVGRAKICVEVSAKKARIDRVSVTPDGMEDIFVGVEYYGLPRCCDKCKVFGHDCSLPPVGVQTKQVWRGKKTQVSNPVGVEKDLVVQDAIVEKVDKGKDVVIDTTPLVTPRALPSQEFNKVINGVKPKPKVTTLVLHSNAFDVLCGNKTVKLHPPPVKKASREGAS